MSDSAMVVFPDPDSPMSASTSPRAIEKETFLTMGICAPSGSRTTTLSPVTCTRSLISFSRSPAFARQAVDEQVHADGQRGNGERRRHDGRCSFGKPGDVLAHQRAE